MSEQGWREFLAATDLEDWVVLHGGATAVYRVASLRDAASLAAAICGVEGIGGSGVLLTLADDRVTVRLTRDLWRLAPHHVELGRAVSAVARIRARPDPGAVQEVQPAIAAQPDEVDVGFWRAVLGYDAMDDDSCRPAGAWIDSLDAGSRPGQADAATRDACRRVRCSGARSGAPRRRWLRVGGWWTGRMHRRIGRWPIGPGIGCVSAGGRTGRWRTPRPHPADAHGPESAAHCVSAGLWPDRSYRHDPVRPQQ